MRSSLHLWTMFQLLRSPIRTDDIVGLRFHSVGPIQDPSLFYRGHTAINAHIVWGKGNPGASNIIYCIYNILAFFESPLHVSSQPKVKNVLARGARATSRDCVQIHHGWLMEPRACSSLVRTKSSRCRFWCSVRWMYNSTPTI